MGVTGAGKSTVGQLLARELGWQFFDADDYHPAANIEKIRQGTPLNDDDRRPWLDRLYRAISEWASAGKNAVLACSALKQSYRKQLQVSADVMFVYLKGSASVIAERLRGRHGHFAGEQILAGQFADLEEPTGSLIVEISRTPDEIVTEIRQRLGLA